MLFTSSLLEIPSRELLELNKFTETQLLVDTKFDPLFNLEVKRTNETNLKVVTLSESV